VNALKKNLKRNLKNVNTKEIRISILPRIQKMKTKRIKMLIRKRNLYQKTKKMQHQKTRELQALTWDQISMVRKKKIQTW
jgi:hypothetical protein